MAVFRAKRPTLKTLNRNKMFQLVFNLVWVPPLDTGQIYHTQVVKGMGQRLLLVKIILLAIFLKV